MNGMQELLEKFRKKYGEKISQIIRLNKKYGSFTVEQEQKEEKPISKATKDILMFTDDSEKNLELIQRMQRLFPETKEQVLSHLKDPGRSHGWEKLFEQYENELTKILGKPQIMENGEKLTGSIKKALEKTLVKSYSYENAKHRILMYLEKIGAELIYYEAGHKLTDHDLDSLDEKFIAAYRVPTSDPDKDCEVIEMVWPVIRIRYWEEDEQEEEMVEIGGICKFYVLER